MDIELNFDICKGVTAKTWSQGHSAHWCLDLQMIKEGSVSWSQSIPWHIPKAVLTWHTILSEAAASFTNTSLKKQNHVIAVPSCYLWTCHLYITHFTDILHHMVPIYVTDKQKAGSLVFCSQSKIKIYRNYSKKHCNIHYGNLQPTFKLSRKVGWTPSLLTMHMKY